MTSRSDVIRVARSWKETKWRHEGRNRNGVDCVGLIAVVAWELSLSSYDFHGYSREPSNLELLRHFRENMQEKAIGEAKPGDVVAFRDGKYPFHVGFLADKYDQVSLVHAYAARRKVVEEMYAPDWAKQVLACFEFYGLES